jgi:hypothetical protein
MQDRKRLGHGQNVPINQSINQSITQTRPINLYRVSAPLQRDTARAMSWVLLPC